MMENFNQITLFYNVIHVFLFSFLLWNKCYMAEEKRARYTADFVHTKPQTNMADNEKDNSQLFCFP